MTTWITVCDTCKRPEWTEQAGQTDGERLAEMIESAATKVQDVKTRRVSCMMGCKHGCNVSIQAHGKLAYTLGNFEPDTDAAAGIVEYATSHATSETGQVPFRTWPQAIKGHFVTRHQPIPEDDA